MPRKDDIQHSVLIVSSSEQFDAIVKKSLRPGNFMSIDFRKNASLARRGILERFYDMIIINAPLPDDNGIELSMDLAEKCNASVLLVVPKEIYDEVLNKVTDYGILSIAKPFPKGRLDQSVRFLIANQNRIGVLERKIRSAEEKMEEQRIVTKAKFLLVEQKHMTEDEAHRLIGKTAMDNGISRARAAERIMDDLD